MLQYLLILLVILGIQAESSMSLWNMIFGSGQNKNINNLKQEALNVSEVENPDNYNQMQHLEQGSSVDPSIKPDSVSQYDQMLGNMSSRYGQTASGVEDIMDRIAYHESAQTMDPSIAQYGGGPGRGLFQFETGEGQGGATAMNRLRRYFKENQMDAPEWTNFDPREGVDASALTPEQQKMMFLANVRYHPTASLEGVTGDNLSEFWQKHHYAGPEDKRGLFDDAMAAYDVKYKPTVDEIAY